MLLQQCGHRAWAGELFYRYIVASGAVEVHSQGTVRCSPRNCLWPKYGTQCCVATSHQGLATVTCLTASSGKQGSLIRLAEEWDIADIAIAM